MKKLTILLALLLLALPLQAGVKVDYEAGVDFAAYRTYAWQEGSVAGQPQVERWIAEAVERELAGIGWRKVSADQADVHVMTHAFSSMDAAASGGYVHVQQFDVGVLTHDVVVRTEGVLVVDIVDTTTDRAVWRGVASEVMGMPSPEKLRRKVDKVTRKMFKAFPSR